MSMFLSREGNLSVFRVGVLFGVLGVAAVAFGFLFFQLEHESRKSPFNVDLYPGAESISIDEPEGRTRRTLVYRVQADAEDVAAYYQEKLDEHLDQDPRDPARQGEHELCVRRPAAGNYENYEEGNGIAPFDYRCVFDNSFLDSEQVTTVQVEPGVRDDISEDRFDNTGYTYIFYTQNWSR